MPEVVALLSGVQERLTQQIGPLKAWLFPRQVYLQLEDEAITAMALEGRRIVWLERVPLPVGLCEKGEPIRIDALGDLLGDLFVERGYGGARVVAVLPAAASQMRLVRWAAGVWPEDPERALALNEAQLGLAQPLQYLDLALLELPHDPPTSFLVTVPGNTLDRWIEVFSFAQLSLERMEAAKPCLCRGLFAMPEISEAKAPLAALQVGLARSSLVVIEHGVPVYERRLPGVAQDQALTQELMRWHDFWLKSRSAESVPTQIILYGSALRDEVHAQELANACSCNWRLFDPLVEGFLIDLSPDFGDHPTGSDLAFLWGLSASEIAA